MIGRLNIVLLGNDSRTRAETLLRISKAMDRHVGFAVPLPDGVKMFTNKKHNPVKAGTVIINVGSGQQQESHAGEITDRV
jgi:hypothetical protein